MPSSPAPAAGDSGWLMRSQAMDCVFDCHASPGHEAEVFSQVGLTYLAEGAANVVYRVSLLGTSATEHPQLMGKLFRFRKSIPSTVPCAQVVSNFHDRIAPLFPRSNLVDLQLYQAPNQHALIVQLNTALQQRELNRNRPEKRRGVYLTPSREEPHEILVTDMSPQGPEERLVEFKPKWLVQSPSAPATATRCRTCALQEMRTEDGRKTGVNHTGRGYSGFCPLDLLSGDDSRLEEVIRALSLTHEFARMYVPMFKEQIQPLLQRLCHLQGEHNNVGLDDFEGAQDQDFSLSMALRDCSVILKSKKGEAGFQNVKLADLDLKTSGGGKLEKWAWTERRLIEEGWYTGTENANSQQQRLCRALQGS